MDLDSLGCGLFRSSEISGASRANHIIYIRLDLIPLILVELRRGDLSRRASPGEQEARDLERLQAELKQDGLDTSFVALN